MNDDSSYAPVNLLSTLLPAATQVKIQSLLDKERKNHEPAETLLIVCMSVSFGVRPCGACGGGDIKCGGGCGGGCGECGTAC
jgi:hypothetical protein